MHKFILIVSCFEHCCLANAQEMMLNRQLDMLNASRADLAAHSERLKELQWDSAGEIRSHLAVSQSSPRCTARCDDIATTSIARDTDVPDLQV